MPSLSALKAELAKPAYAGLAPAQAAAKLNADTTGTKPAPILESELLGLLQPAEFAAVFDHPRFTELKRDIEGQNRAGVGLWTSAFRMRGLIGDATAAAVLAYLGRTVPASTVAVAVFGVAVTDNDVAAARSL